jgi:two-component system NtrC family sensor kinase
MLKTKLFKAFAAMVILFGVLSAFVGHNIINRQVIDEAQRRVTLDLSSAKAICKAKQNEIETVVKFAAIKEAVLTMCEAKNWSDADVLNRLERIRMNFGLDFLDVIAPDGKVVMRASEPHAVGDYKTSDPSVSSALKGDPMSCMAVFNRTELEKEGENLADKAFLSLEETPRARRSPRTEETRGMVMVSSAPVRQGPNVIAVIHGGVLINRNHKLVDSICDVVFKNETRAGVPIGTATIFLDDVRIATTVRLENNNRALGTRAEKKVADCVLDNAKAWVGDAYVVNDTYLAAYEPIPDGNNGVIGMLYVGILKKPFDDIAKNIMLRYVFVSLFVLLVALVLAFIIASRIAQPIHKLVEASKKMSNGERPGPIPVHNSCHETEQLTSAFNEMTHALVEREEKLTVLNRSYMETLGFVSHELKGPVATIMNYVYLLREQKMGPMNEKQLKAVRTIDYCGNHLIEMVRHYLNLSRIENGEFQPVKTRIAVLEDIVTPVLESAETEIEGRKMRVSNRIDVGIVLLADMNMTREVFENLIHNAIKYGRDGGSIVMTAKPAGDFIEFSMRNEGEGIPPDKMSRLFQKFSRANGEKRQKGTGLGLFITKHIVEAHGGKIGITSQMGEWVEVVFTMPRHRDAAVVS